MLLDRIQANFEFLFKDYNFVPSESGEENSDWVVVLILGYLRIRFVEDRANLFLDVGLISEPDVWYELQSVLSLVKERQDMNGDIQCKNNVNSLKALLRKYLKALVLSVKDDEFRRAVSALKSV